MRVGWLITLVLVITATMPPIAVGQAQAQEAQGKQTEKCPHPEGWIPAAEDLPHILVQHREWMKRWSDSFFYSKQWAEDHPQGRANLCNADLGGAKLNDANLRGAELNKAHLARANLANTTYAPASPPPDAYVAGIQGLRTIIFPNGEETGLVQLRELLQKAGLRNLEREATFSIERGKTWHLLNAFAYWQAEHPDDETIPKQWVQLGLYQIIGFDLIGLGKAVLDHPQVLASILHHG